MHGPGCLAMVVADVSGVETGFARRENGRWLLARFHGTWLARRTAIGTALLANYIGTDGDSSSGNSVMRDGAALYVERLDRGQWSVGVRRAERFRQGRSSSFWSSRRCQSNSSEMPGGTSLRWFYHRWMDRA